MSGILKSALLFLLLCSVGSAQNQNPDWDLFGQLLQKYVQGNRVDYNGLIADQEQLFKITDQLSVKSPDSHPDEFKTDSDKLAYWINAYNAFILKKIVENYPVESIKDINFIGVTIWLDKNLVGGKKISFKSLEDKIIRERFRDARIHFAINCASISCPPLQNFAYRGDKLDFQLDLAAKKFINNKNNIKIDVSNQKIYISAIFDWYEEDFLEWEHQGRKITGDHILDYIKLYYDGEINADYYDFELIPMEYDWGLNKTDNASQ